MKLYPSMSELVIFWTLVVTVVSAQREERWKSAHREQRAEDPPAAPAPARVGRAERVRAVLGAVRGGVHERFVLDGPVVRLVLLDLVVDAPRGLGTVSCIFWCNSTLNVTFRSQNCPEKFETRIAKFNRNLLAHTGPTSGSFLSLLRRRLARGITPAMMALAFIHHKSTYLALNGRMFSNLLL